MFGLIELPDGFKYKSLMVKAEYADDKKNILYYRDLSGDIVEKKIFSKSKSSLIINPVEPTNTPKSISPYLQIEFDHPVLAVPRSECSFFLTFPLEIGIFLAGQKKKRLIDVFSLCKQKFTLYGEPTGGIICKHWQSRIYDSLPQVSLLETGTIEMVVINDTANWNEISKVIFNS